MKKSQTTTNPTDYQRGAIHCAAGIKPREDESDGYYTGYGDQYAKEQIADALMEEPRLWTETHS